MPQFRHAIPVSKIGLVQVWQQSMDIEKDVHIALCGGEGDGKSQMGYQFIREFPDANFWDNVVYTGNPKELSDKYANLQKKSIMVLDEALNSISRLDWNNADVKSMVKFFRTVVRKEKMSTWIYLCQLLRDMHGFWRNHRCTWLIEMGVREFYDPSCNGVFVFHRTRVPFLTGKRDVWLLDDQENFWLGEARKYKIGGTNYANMLRMHPYYFGEISVGKLPQSVWDEYEKNRKKAYAEYTPDEEKPLGKREIKMQEKLVKIIELAKDRGIEEREIALAIGVTPGSFSSTKLRYRDKITTY